MTEPKIVFCCAALTLIAAGCGRELADRRATPIPVRVEIAKRTAFSPELVLLGTIRASETIPLVVMKSGTLRYPRRFAGGLRTGERVNAGELVAEIVSDQAQFALTQARLQMEALQADFEREKRSFEQGVASSAEFSGYKVRANLAREAFKAAQKDIERLRIIASRGGQLVVTKPLAFGAPVDQGATLGEISLAGPAVVEASAAAADRAQLRPGLEVQLSRADWKGGGTVREVASVIDAAGTARVVVSIAPGTPTPPPGTGVDVRVVLDRQPDAITIPEDALVAGGDGAAVFVIGPSEGFGSGYSVKRVAVQTAGRANGRVAIRSGVRDGDRVIISGADALSDDSLVIEVAAGAKR
jgi:membrane fusion protein, multidrug efflux system